MYNIRRSIKPLIYATTAVFMFFSCYIPTVQAGIVNTETLIDAQANREKVTAFLNRQDVQTQLMSQGVNQLSAIERVNRMTDNEIASLSGQIDNLPAGGDVVGAVVFIFLVLLITDLIGLTDVYPFVKHNH